MTNLILLAIIAVAVMGIIVGLKIALSIMRASRQPVSSYGSDYQTSESSNSLTFNFLVLLLLLLGTYWIITNYSDTRDVNFPPYVEEQVQYKRIS